MLHRIAFPFIVLAVTTGYRVSSPPRTALHLAKQCSEYTGKAGDHCTVVRTNVSQIPRGSKVFYLKPANLKAATYDGDVELRVNRANIARGHCTVANMFSKTAKTVLGNCTFSGGTGRFKKFDADIVVSVDATDPSLSAWNGTLSFSGNAGKN